MRITRVARTIWRWLTEPAKAIQTRDNRRRARLLSSLLVPLIPISVAAFIVHLFIDPAFSPSLIAVGGLGILVMAYGLSRTRYYTWAAVLTAGLFPATIFATILTTYNPADFRSMLTYLAVGVLLGSMLFSLRGAIALAIIDAVGMLLLPVFIPEVTLATITPPLTLLMLLTIIALVVVRHRALLEADLQAELVRSIEELRRGITEWEQAEDAFQESKAKYRALLEQSGDAIYITSQDGKIIYLNQAGLDLFGFTRDDTPVNVRDLYVDPDERVRFQREIEQRGAVRDYEVRLKKRDGRVMNCLLTTTARRSDDGTGLEYHGILRDITAHRRAEQALRQYADRLSILREIYQAILAAESPEAIAYAVLDCVRHLIPYQRASVVVFDMEAELARILAVRVNGETQLGSRLNVPLEEYGVAEELWEGKLHLVEDTLSLSELSPVVQTLRDEGIRAYLNMPLVFKGELIGSLNVGADTPGAFDHEQLGIAREIADQLAIAFQQSRLLETEREQRALAEALADTAAALNSTLDLDTLMGRILDNVRAVVPHDAANIMLIESGFARVVGRRGYAERGLDEAVLAVRYPVADTPNLGQMIKTGESLVIPDTRHYAGWVLSEQTHWIQAYVGAPVRLEGQVIGFLNLDSATPGFFTPDHAKRLQAFADQAAVAIRNAQLYEAEQKRRHIAETLRQAAAVLTSTLELDELLDLILQQLRDVIAYDSASIQRIENGHLILMAGHGFKRTDRVIGLQFPIDPKFPNMRVVTTKKPLAIADVTQEYPHFQVEANTYESGHIRSWLGVPLLVKDDVIGMITLDRTEVRPYTDEDIELAITFANQAAIAVENAWLHQTTRERATRLELVGRVGHRATAILALDDLLHQAVELINEAFGYYHTVILLVEDEDLVLKATTLRSLRQREGKLRLRVGVQGITGWVAAQGTPLLVPDVSQEPRYRAEKEETETRSELAVPIKLRAQIIGVLDVQSHMLDAFTEADVSTLQTIADQLAVAIHNAQLYEQTHRHAAELEERVAERTAELSVANEQLQALGRLKDEFVANVSHELRTPISNIKLYHRLLVLNPRKRESYMATLQRETERLEYLVEDLLYLSRLDQGRMAFSPTATDLNTLVDTYVTDRASLAEGKGLTLTLSQEEELPVVQADQKLLGQALGILLTNALNYTPAGGRVVVFTQIRQFEGEQWAGIGVVDDGPGIPQEEQAHLFERFFRGKVGRDSGAPGTGLGLAIAKEIVGRHRGRLEVTSEGVPGKGSTFTVWLPVETSQS